MKQLPRTLAHIRRDWGALSPYQRFETATAWVLTNIVALIILVALYRLLVSVVDTLVFAGLNPLDHSVFQQVFGEIMTLLIALEFNHSLHYGVTPKRGIVHAKLVVLIAALAIARKLIVADFAQISAGMAASLAALVLALAIAYRLMGEPERTRARQAPAPPRS